MTLALKGGVTSQSIYVEILDSTSTTGGRKTGLVFNSSGLTAYYVRQGGSATAITLATLTNPNSAYSSGGFKEVDATNMPGIYRLDIPDAAIAAGVKSVVVTLKGATGMVQISKEIRIVAYDPDDSVRIGMTALPNAAAEAPGGLYTRGSGAGQINQAANGQIDSNAVALSGDSTTADKLEAITDTLLNNTAQAGAAGSITLNSGAVATDDYYKGQLILLTGGAGAGQIRLITGYTGSSKVATVSPNWKTNPDNTSTFITFPFGQVDLWGLLGTVFSTPATAGVMDVNIKNIANAVVNTALAQLGVNVVSYASGQAPLQPTVAGRTLDVSAGGEAGLDWANIGSPSTAQNLSATDIRDVGRNVVGNVNGNVVGSVATVTNPVSLNAKDTLAVRNNTAQAGAGTTITLDSGASSTDDLYKGQLIKIDSGAGAGQTRIITGYVGSTKVATVDRAWATNPDNTSIFTIVSDEAAKLDSSLQVTAASVQGNVTGSVASVSGNVGGNVVGAVGSVANGGISASSFAAGAIDNAAIAANAIGSSELDATAIAEIADGVWDEAISGHLSAGSTGAALNAAGSAGDPWSTPLPGAYGAGTAGNIIGNNLDTNVGSRLASGSYTTPPTVTQIRTEMDSNSTKLANLDTNVSSRAPSATALSNVDYTAARAAKLDNLDATVSSRLASAGYTAPDNASISTILADTTNIKTRLPAALTGAGNIKADAQVVSDKTGYALTSGERTSIADALLDRDLAAGTDSGGRTVRNALRLLRNKVTLALGIMTVTKENDTTTAWTATVTTDAAALPIVGIDP